MSLTERQLLSMMTAYPIFTPMKESPQLTEWTCRLLTWHGLFQHPMAKDKSKWYLFPERAIAALENGQMDEMDDDVLQNTESYTEDTIRAIFEDSEDVPLEKRVTSVHCAFDSLPGNAAIALFIANNGPHLNDGEWSGAEFLAVYNKETETYSWRPRTVVDAEVVRRFWHHMPSSSELNIMARENTTSRVNKEGKWE